ncbi:MAG: hypothetical protein U0229_19475 [Anaeromyxobacter sp.]
MHRPALAVAATALLASAAPALAGEPAVVYVPSEPRLLVADGGRPFVLLESAIARTTAGEPVLRLTYVASTHREAALADDAATRALGAAVALLETVAPALSIPVEKAEVTAVFGAPGTWGIGMPIRVIRADGGWSSARLGEGYPVLLPPLPEQAERLVASAAEAYDLEAPAALQDTRR